MASTLVELSSLSGEWILAWDGLDDGMGRALAAAGLDRPVIWAGIRGDGRAVGLLRALSLLEGSDLDQERRIEQGLALRDAACPAGETWVHGIAELTDLQVSVDLDRRALKRSSEVAELLDTKAKAVRVFSKPSEWKGKAYHRAEKAGDEHARKNAESVARDRWTTKVLRILVSARLPFGVEVQEKGWDYLGPEASRCLRGLRATTLQKRVTDFGPFLRFLKASTGKLFPTEKSEVLSYFAARLEEQAARTVFRSLLHSLRFFEEAGEVPPSLRLTSDNSLEGAAREYERKRRLLAEASGAKSGRHQPPQCF